MLELYKKENSARLIFVHKVTRKNILTAKITQTTVDHVSVHSPTVLINNLHAQQTRVVPVVLSPYCTVQSSVYMQLSITHMSTSIYRNTLSISRRTRISGTRVQQIWGKMIDR